MVYIESKGWFILRSLEAVGYTPKDIMAVGIWIKRKNIDEKY